MRVLELFSGIGGAAAALAGRAEIVGAVDHDRRAEAVYRANWPHRVHVKNLESVKLDWLAAFEADLWWMSPPCAPHGIRGAQRDVEDRRSASFLRLIDAIEALRPHTVALENVPWFAESVAWTRLREVFERAGYTSLATFDLCPTELGIPAVRRRFYAIASQGSLIDRQPPPVARRPLAPHLGPWREELAVPSDLLARYSDALHVVDADDPDAIAACFTRAYGTSPVYAGSYLRQRVDGAPRLRRFAPEEIASLYGFPPGFHFAGLPDPVGWKLVGNSVSVDAVNWVLGATKI